MKTNTKNNTEQKERAIDRLKIFAEYARSELGVVKGLNSFEQYCNIGNAYISNSDKKGRGKGSIGSDVIANISEVFPMLNVKWLCTGKGEMIAEQSKLEEKIEAIKKILM